MTVRYSETRTLGKPMSGGGCKLDRKHSTEKASKLYIFDLQVRTSTTEDQHHCGPGKPRRV